MASGPGLVIEGSRRALSLQRSLLRNNGRWSELPAPGWIEASTLRDVPSTNLTRPQRGKLIAGVCAGIARRYGVPARRVRIVFVLSLLLPGPQMLLYIALWILVPKE